MDGLVAHVAQAYVDAKEKVRLAGMRTFPDGRLLQVDLAVRDWARRDERVAERLRRVYNRRMQLACDMIGTFCSDPDEVEARSLLAFCLAIGHHFLAADHPDRSHAAVRARAADLILDVRPGEDLRGQ